MANPLYPGFDPGDSKDLSGPGSLYPGYYVGKPLPRKLPSREFLQPLAFDFDVASQFIKDLDVNFRSLPTWLKDQYFTEFKRNLSVSIKPDNLSRFEEDAFDDQSLPGAFGVEISLNPQDWIKDPKKQFVKTVDGWRKKVFNADDIQNRVKAQTWGAIIEGKNIEFDDYGFLGLGKQRGKKVDPAGMRVKSAVESVYTGKHSLGSTLLGTAHPMALTEPYLKEKVADNLIAFWESEDNQVARDKAFDSLRHGMFVGLGQDLYDRRAGLPLPAIRGVTPAQAIAYRDDVINNFYKQATVASLTITPKNYIADAAGNVVMVRGMDDLISGKAGLSTALSKYIVTGGNDSAVALGKLRDGITANITETRRALASVQLTGEAGKRFRKVVGAYTAKLAELEQINTAITGMLPDIHRLKDSNRVARELLAGKLKLRISALESGGIRGKGIKHGDPFFGSIHRDLLDCMEYQVRSSGNSGVIGDLIQTSQDANGIRALIYLKTTREERSAEVYVGIWDALAEGKFASRYVWPRIYSILPRRLEIFTPGVIAERVLKKSHYFGFKMAENTKGELAGYAWANRLFKNSRKFRHKFGLAGDYVDSAGARVAYKAVMEGGVAFKSMASLLDAMGRHLISSADIAQLLSLHGRGTNLVTFLRGSDPLARKILGSLHLEGSDITDFADNLGVLFTQLNSNQQLRGHLNDVRFLESFVKRLYNRHKDPNTLGITRKYIGGLERLWSGLNRFQQTVIERWGKYLAPVAYLKSFLVHQIADAAKKAFDWIAQKLAATAISGYIAGITAGAGVVLKPLIDWAVKHLYTIFKFLARKFIDTAETFIRGIMHGDILAVFAAAQKAIGNILKTFLMAVGIPILVLFAILFGLFGTVFSNTSPVDPAVVVSSGFAGGGYGGEGGNGIPGENNAPPRANTTSCPLNSPSISTTSYTGTGDSASGHGSNNYWSGNAAGACSYSIPYITYSDRGVCPSTGAMAACAPIAADNINVCNRISVTPQQTYYGFAIDVRGSSGNVYLPKIGDVTEWTLGSYFPINGGAWGNGLILTASDSPHIYKLYLGHIVADADDLNKTLPINESIGILYVGNNFNSHVHIELMIDGIAVRPEDNFLVNMCK